MSPWAWCKTGLPAPSRSDNSGPSQEKRRRGLDSVLLLPLRQYRSERSGAQPATFSPLSLSFSPSFFLLPTQAALFFLSVGEKRKKEKTGGEKRKKGRKEGGGKRKGRKKEGKRNPAGWFEKPPALSLSLFSFFALKGKGGRRRKEEDEKGLAIFSPSIGKKRERR